MELTSKVTTNQAATAQRSTTKVVNAIPTSTPRIRSNRFFKTTFRRILLQGDQQLKCLRSIDKYMF